MTFGELKAGDRFLFQTGDPKAIMRKVGGGHFEYAAEPERGRWPTPADSPVVPVYFPTRKSLPYGPDGCSPIVLAVIAILGGILIAFL
jgi:hypothetical protein